MPVFLSGHPSSSAGDWILVTKLVLVQSASRDEVQRHVRAKSFEMFCAFSSWWHWTAMCLYISFSVFFRTLKAVLQQHSPESLQESIGSEWLKLYVVVWSSFIATLQWYHPNWGLFIKCSIVCQTDVNMHDLNDGTSKTSAQNGDIKDTKTLSFLLPMRTAGRMGLLNKILASRQRLSFSQTFLLKCRINKTCYFFYFKIGGFVSFIWSNLA